MSGEQPYRTPGVVDAKPMTLETFERLACIDIASPLRLSPNDFYAITRQLSARVDLDSNGLEFFVVFTPKGARRVEVSP